MSECCYANREESPETADWVRGCSIFYVGDKIKYILEQTKGMWESTALKILFKIPTSVLMQMHLCVAVLC